MLRRIKTLLDTYSTVPDFQALVLCRFWNDPEGKALVMHALSTAEDAHKDEFRLDGKPVISHPIAVAVLLLEYLQLRNPDVIAGALLHLFIEDVEGWDFDRLVQVFGFEVAILVWLGSKQTGDDGNGWELRTRIAQLKLLHAPLEAQMLKLCDRFNNLLSISSLEKWKQLRMLQGTVAFYVPLSRSIKVLEEELLEAIKEASRVSEVR